jgi:drug/metabolite transporter (DMT)-like permease
MPRVQSMSNISSNISMDERTSHAYLCRVPDRPLVHAPRSQILIAFAAVYIIWGSTYLAIRFAIETLPPFLMVGSRFLVAGTAMYIWLRARGAEAPQAAHWRSAAIKGLLMPVLGTGMVVWAEEKVPSGIAALLVSIEPLWIVLLQWWRRGGTRPTVWVIGGLVLGLGGLYLLVDPGGDSQRGNIALEGLLLFAALSWAVGSLYSKRAPEPKTKFLGTGMEMITAGIMLIAAGFITGETNHFSVAAISAKSWLSLLYLTTF